MTPDLSPPDPESPEIVSSKNDQSKGIEISDDKQSTKNNTSATFDDDEFVKGYDPSTGSFPDVPPLYDKPARVLKRDDWGAKMPKWIYELKTPVRKVVLTWTETDSCYTTLECVLKVKDLQEQHMAETGVPDIKHNFLLGGNGTMFEGRGFRVQGPKYPETSTKTQGLTGESIEIAFIDKCTNKPTPQLLKALSECIAFGINGKYIEKSFSFYWMSDKDVMYIQPAMVA